MTKKKRNPLLLILVFLVILLMVWVYRNNEQQQAEAKKAQEAASNTSTSGEITIYTAYEEDSAKEYLKAFEAQYPDIEINLFATRTTTLTNRILAEQNNPQADVIWGLSSLRMLLLEWNDHLKGYEPTGFELVNEKFRPENTPPKWVGLDARMIAFCVNPAELTKQNLPVPLSWADLTNPVYEGKIILSLPASATSGYLVLSTALQLYGETDGWEYIEQLDKNVGEYVDGGSASCQKVGDGDYLIGVGFVYQMVAGKAEGMPIDIIFPTEGVGWEPQTMGLMNKPEMKPAAKTFIDWAITDQAMTQYAQNRAVTGLQTDVSLPEGYPDNVGDHLLDQDFPWMTANRGRVLRDWEKRFSTTTELIQEDQ